MSQDKKNTKQSSREQKFFNNWRKLFQFVITHIFYMIRLKLIYRLEVTGKENIPSTNDYIVAGNHLSTLDPPLLAAVLNRPIAYMAKKELFEDKSKLLSFLVHTLGAFAVNREKPEIATFKTVKAVFNTPWSLGIFPQGKIIKEPVLSHVHKGFIMFAKKFKANIVPVGICGFDGYAKKLFEKNITVKVGKPISYELDENEIMREWAKQICEFTGYENKIEDSIINQTDC